MAAREWKNAADAAADFGVTARTLRRRVERGELERKEWRDRAYFREAKGAAPDGETRSAEVPGALLKPLAVLASTLCVVDCATCGKPIALDATRYEPGKRTVLWCPHAGCRARLSVVL